MKNLLIVFLAVIAVNLTNAQSILIADNNAGAPSGSHVYGTLQAAIDAATDGDIIHVIPSPNNYGEVTINNAQSGISIFGIGFNPDKDGPAKSLVNQIFIYASNVRISGLRVTDYIYIGTSNSNLSNIAIENSDIDYIQSSTTSSFTGSNILIRNCFLARGDHGYAVDLSSRISNSVITNCIIGGNHGSFYGSITAYNGCVIKNNVFFGDGGADQNAFYYLHNSTVSNNIFFGREPRWYNSISNTTFNNNVSAGSANNSLPPTSGSGVTGNNNFITLTDSTQIFEDPNIVIGNNWNYNWVPTLKSGSILINAGTDGTDVGPMGSTLPWDPTGVPLPLIQSVISSEVIKQGDNMDVTIKARGN